MINWLTIKKAGRERYYESPILISAAMKPSLDTPERIAESLEISVAELVARRPMKPAIGNILFGSSAFNNLFAIVGNFRCNNGEFCLQLCPISFPELYAPASCAP